MLLGNNSSNNNNNMSSNSAVFRKSRTPTSKRKEKNAVSSARNSWSFSDYLPSNSSSNQPRDSKGAPKVGTLSKGVDYIRTSIPVQKSPSYDWHLSAVEDRTLYGNPDGQSDHSISERDDSSNRSRKETLDILRNLSTTTDEPLRNGHGGGHQLTVPSPDTSLVAKEAEESPLLVRKGLLWLMRDHLFSRWHERYCLLTRNYLNCFKRASESALTPMGAFLFKINLAEVISVEWLDKKGTAIVALNVAKEGRIFIKTSHDLTGWFTAIQNYAREAKRGRRQTLMARLTCDMAIVKPTRNQQNRLSYMETSRLDDDEMEAHSLLFVPGHHRIKTDDSPRSSASPSALRAAGPFRDRSSSFDRLHAPKSDRDSTTPSYIRRTKELRI